MSANVPVEAGNEFRGARIVCDESPYSGAQVGERVEIRCLARNPAVNEENTTRGPARGFPALTDDSAVTCSTDQHTKISDKTARVRSSPKVSTAQESYGKRESIGRIRFGDNILFGRALLERGTRTCVGDGEKKKSSGLLSKQTRTKTGGALERRLKIIGIAQR